MDFLKKHYEKILLGVMLFGLIGVLVFMIFFIAADKSAMTARGEGLTNPRVKPLSALDTTVEDSALGRLKTPYNLDFESTNKLLNPLEWQRALDGTLIPVAKKTGAQMAVVTAITPLYLIITFESTVTNELGSRYVIKVEKQAAPTMSKRQPARHYVAVGDKPNDAFSLQSVKGPPENPDGLVLKLADSGDEITVAKDKPYRHTDAYAADFRYEPEKNVFRGRRINDKITFGGVDYTVVEVNSNELILMDQSNQKKTSLPFAP
jgi:hypothetical protein